MLVYIVGGIRLMRLAVLEKVGIVESECVVVVSLFLKCIDLFVFQ